MNYIMGLESSQVIDVREKVDYDYGHINVSQYSYDNVQATIPRIKKRPTGILM